MWQTINWDYQHLIWCCVDEENKEIRIGIPVGNATVPNQTLTMNYMEGLSGPDPLQPVCGPGSGHGRGPQVEPGRYRRIGGGSL